MSYFTSWAQNNEDVLLWRVLKHVNDGFYIDVGANDPDEHSVTKAFYERGWHGINIEPLPQFRAAFETERPRDINLSIAAGSLEGELTLYDVPDVRGWASPDSTVARAHQEAGYRIAELSVPVQRLDAICAQYVKGPIHFLKVDVEGFEGEVLRGMDFVRFRPWLVVVEATLPGSTECNHGEWEHLLLGQGYHFGYFDGLNRYYVADEQKHMLPQLAVPVNVFDEYLSIHLVRAWERLEQAQLHGQQADHRIEILDAYQQNAMREIDHLKQNLADSEQRYTGIVLHATRVEQVLTALQDQFTNTNAQLANANVQLANTSAQLTNTSAQLANATEQIADLRARLDAETLRANVAQDYIAAVHVSSSWRLTAPLRKIGTLQRLTRQWLLQQRDKARPLFQHPLRYLLITLARPLLWFTRNYKVRALLLPKLEKFPLVHQHLKQTVAVVRQDKGPPPIAPQEQDLPDLVRELPVSTRKILADLNRITK